MWEEIQQFLEQEYQLKDLRPDMKVKTDLGLNSFDFMNLICLIEDQYGVELEEERYRKLETLADLCDYLEELRKDTKKS